MDHQAIIKKAGEIVEANAIQGGEFTGQICVLSLIDENGYPTAAVLTPSKADGIREVMLCTSLDGNAAKRAANCNRASVSFNSAEYCVNLVGEIEFITDPTAKKDMWYDGLSFHYSGPEDPNYGLLKFTTKRYKLFVGYEEAAGEF